jgi:localization factor PodJL
MNSRVSWSVDGIDPSVRDRAEAAARRAGMSLNDWLNSSIGEPPPPDFRDPYPPQQPAYSQQHRAVDDIHQRLDSITRQIEQIAKPRAEAPRSNGQAPRGEPPVARQLNDAISRLDARLSQISNPQPVRQQAERQDRQQQTEMVERAANQVYRASPPLSPSNFDSAIAEIAARQNELDEPRRMPPRQAPPAQFEPPAQYAPPMAPHALRAQQPQYAPQPQFAPQQQQFAPQTHYAPQPSFAPQPMAPAPQMAPPPSPPGPDFSSLERHLFKITSQIEALQRPDYVEQSIAAFRNELAEIRHVITEAMPRRAIETIENEIRSLSRRIDETRSSGIDGQQLAGIEHALTEVREALLSLKPAEQLAGYDEAIRNLHAKLDLILRANDDPSTVHQLEGAIAALRSIVSNVASNDALARLSDDVQMLSSRVDQLAHVAHSSGHSDALALLDQRIAALTSTIESREQQRPVETGNNNEYLENAIRSLSERIDRMPVGNDNASAFAHLEQRVSYLLERVEAATEPRGNGNNLDQVEGALQDILRHLETQHANLAAIADNASRQSFAPPPQMESSIVDAVKRELSDIRFGQSETDRRTQDALETVHSTLGHVVDRLAMIEGDLRDVRAAPPAPAPAPEPPPAPPARAYVAPEPTYAAPEVPRISMPPMPRPELPNPAASQTQFSAPAEEHFVAAPRNFGAAEPAEPAPPPVPAAIPATPRAISEILVPHTTPRAAIEPDLPPDHPLEPGTRPSPRISSPSERIAASEDALAEIPAPGPKEPVSTSSFIAAARRAAQAAAANAQNDKRSAKAAAKATDKAKEKAKEKPKDKIKAAPGTPGTEGSSITSKIRSLLVGASVVVIVLGTFKMAMNLLDTGSAPPMPAMEEPASTLSPLDRSVAPALPAAPAPSLTSPTPLGKQSNNSTAPNMLSGSQITITQGANPPAAAPIPATDVTGSISPASQASLPAVPAPKPGRFSQIQVPPTEQLPDAIGGPVLRSAALKGDATAAYEIGVRFAEGKGVPANLDEAAKWYDRAANAGVVPAIFRLGTFYEKGMSVKKDADIARRYYLMAAERGNAKAMHNLAVLDADGGGKGADYKAASGWFRKAADRGVADSQYNLGILYARGIGVDQNLAESFKWFSLAAAQGDADSNRKRDDIAKRLDPQSLAAAKLAIQTFTAEPQPDDAINVAAPAGGWDNGPTQASAAKPAAKPAKRTTPVTASH